MKHFTVDYDHSDKKDSKAPIGRIRFGLSAVKGLGDAALEAILAMRDEKGAASSIYQFCEQASSLKVNKKVLEALIKSGAMDGFNRPRKQLMLIIDKAMSQAQLMHKDNSRGQTNMFEMFATSDDYQSQEDYPDVGEYAQKEKLQMEREAVGFYLSGHPLDPYQKIAKSLGAIPTVQLATAHHLEEVSVVGVVSELKERPLKSGKGRWAVVIIEDSFGQAEALCFSNSYDEAEPLLKTKEPLIFSGRALIDDADEEGAVQKPKMRLTNARLLADVQIEKMSCLKIDMRAVSIDENSLRKVSDLMKAHPGDKPVQISFAVDDVLVEIRLPKALAVKPTDELIVALEEAVKQISVRRE